MTPQPVLALVGPTASGKSEVAMAIARARQLGDLADVELVAADAFTLYRGMDVGTATPSAEERQEVPHHLVDELDPWQDATVAWFQQRAREAIADVHDRGCVPLLVGGSGLYLRAVIDDLRFPPTDPDVRAAIEQRYAADPTAAHAAVAAVDPDAAARIAPENLRRSVRALEVIELTGEPFSAYDDAFGRYESIYPGLQLRALEVARHDLRHAIERRAARMIDAGLLNEAAALPRDRLSRTARQAIGYAEAFAALDGEMAREELAGAIATRTWRYARRQLAWFRRDPRVTWSGPAETVAAWT